MATVVQDLFLLGSYYIEPLPTKNPIKIYLHLNVYRKLAIDYLAMSHGIKSDFEFRT